jgi:hypothetical protein
MHAMGMFDYALDAYWDRVLPEPVPLTFDLAAGQPVYDLLGLDYACVAVDETPPAVMLDPARRWRLPPLEPWETGTDPVQMLVMGSLSGTMLYHLDFVDGAGAPSFDAQVYHWLRAEDLLPCLWQSGSPHAAPLQRLWTLYQNQPLLKRRGGTPRPFDGPYTFFGLPPLF